MTFDTHGFFSPDMNQFRIAVKGQEPTKFWFDYAHDLNTFALDLIRDRKTPPFSDTRRFTLAALFIRAHQSFQAAVMPGENGMIGDARAVLRTAVEGGLPCMGLPPIRHSRTDSPMTTA